MAERLTAARREVLSKFASISCLGSCGSVSVEQNFHLVKFGVNYYFASALGAVFAP